MRLLYSETPAHRLVVEEVDVHQSDGFFCFHLWKIKKNDSGNAVMYRLISDGKLPSDEHFFNTAAVPRMEALVGEDEVSSLLKDLAYVPKSMTDFVRPLLLVDEA